MHEAEMSDKTAPRRSADRLGEIAEDVARESTYHDCDEACSMRGTVGRSEHADYWDVRVHTLTAVEQLRESVAREAAEVAEKESEGLLPVLGQWGRKIAIRERFGLEEK